MMIPFTSKKRTVTALASAFAAATLIGLLTGARTTGAQTPSAIPTPPPKKMKLRSRDLPPPDEAALKAMPNFAEKAPTLRHWRQPEITYHLTPDTNDRRTPEQEKALVAQGLALWNGKIGNKVTLKMIDDADSADVEIGFVPAGTLSSGRIGETEIHFTVPQNDIQRAQIRLIEGLSADQVVQAVAHESGHVLGIQGHSDDKSDLMYPYSHLPATISDRDVNTLNIAYFQIDTSKKTRDFQRDQKFGSVKSY